MPWVEHVHADAVALATALAAALQAACNEALAARGHARLVLAGGSTPLPAYRALAAAALPWTRVTVFPSDERCVPHDHPACNLRALREAFAAAAGLVPEPLTTADGDPDASEREARARLACHPQAWDAVVLGMGLDAHTASLFPGAPQLAAALAVEGVMDASRIDPRPLPADAPYPRITLTAARLLRARALVLAVTGEAKRAVLQAALESGDPLRHPVAALVHGAATPVQIHWSP